MNMAPQFWQFIQAPTVGEQFLAALSYQGTLTVCLFVFDKL